MEKPQVSALPITNTDRTTTERSISDCLGDFSWIQKATLQLYGSNVPHLHMSRYITARDSGLPHVSTASNKRWGEKDWVQGYATSVLVLAALFSKQSAHCGCSYW